MGKLRTLGNRLATADLRRVRPEPKRADSELFDPRHAAWRREVMGRAHWRCQAVTDGQRCPAKHPDARLFGDHILERSDRPDLAFEPSNGAALCGRHHTEKTAAARAERFGLGRRTLRWTLAPQQEPAPEPKDDLSAPGRLTIA